MSNIERHSSWSLEIGLPFLLYLMALGISHFISSLLTGELSLMLYLPAGIKLLSILVFQWRGALGIGLAILARFTLYDDAYTLAESVAMASINAGASWLVIYSFLKTFKISTNLENLNLWHIIGLAAICSITNALLFSWLQFAFGHLSHEQYWHKVFLILVNNFTANALLVWLLTYASRYWHLIQRAKQA